MVRKVFFSFDYEGDIGRIWRVRNSWVTLKRDGQPFSDKADWEEVKKGGNRAIKNWIDKQLVGTSVTVVLIGYRTASREWVNYEIKESIERGNGLLGIYIHNIKDFRTQGTSLRGGDPFARYLGLGYSLAPRPRARCYDWVNDSGFYNIGTWVETAAQQAGR